MSRLAEILADDLLPERVYKTDNVQLFLYNAVLWNAHRIHFDTPYAKEVEGYPGLVTAGPLMGDWLTQCAIEWLADDGTLVSFEYSNRKAAYIGDLLTVGGNVVASDTNTGEVELELHVKNKAGDIITPGKAIVSFANT